MGTPQQRHRDPDAGNVRPLRPGGDGRSQDHGRRRTDVEGDVARIRSFEDVYVAEWGPLVGLAYSLTGSRETAEELVQEAMLRAYRHWGRISGFDRPGAWVRRALLNLVASRWRRRRAGLRAVLRLDRPSDAVDVQPDTDVVWSAVRSLPRRQAEVVALYYACDLSVDDIADTLDCAPGTVRTHLARARQALGRLLGEDS